MLQAATFFLKEEGSEKQTLCRQQNYNLTYDNRQFCHSPIFRKNKMRVGGH